jgi:glutamate synthase domain-containing protein 2
VAKELKLAPEATYLATKTRALYTQFRGIPMGKPAVTPPTFSDLSSAEDFKRFGDRVRELIGDIPIGFKRSAQHVGRDIDFALAAGAD